MPVDPGVLDRVETARLLLLRPEESDREVLREMHRDDRVMATLGGTRSDAESDVLLDVFRAHWAAHHFGYWIVRDPASGRFVGRGGLRLLVVDGTPEIEVGYGLMSEFWGRGFATEIAEASVRAAFDVVGVRSLVCFTMPSNAKSRRVMEKAGFRYEKDFVHAQLPHRLCRLDAPG